MDKKSLIQVLKKQKFPKEILEAFEAVPRENFVPIDLKEKSYEDTSLPIGHGATISQPYTIAFMLMLLDVRDGQKILEVGSGSGYVLALLSELNLNGEIIGIERIPELADGSREKLSSYDNIKILKGNALKDVNEEGFDRILVSASSEDIPQKLLDKLKFNGKMVVPVRDSIMLIEKTSGENKISQYQGFNFVPLIEE